jgi:mannitol 2-dehydrogenase
VARLCAESTDRIPKWVVPVIRHNLRTGGSISHATAIVASWARYAEGVDEQGDVIEIVDRLATAVTSAARRYATDPLALVEMPALFGDLVDSERFRAEYRRLLASIHHLGVRGTLDRLNGSDEW